MTSYINMPSLSGGTSMRSSDILQHETKTKPVQQTKQEPAAVEYKSVDKLSADLSARENPAQAEQSREQLQEVVEQLNDHVQQLQRKLEFTVDDESGQMVVKVFDKESEELIRQIPSEDALQLARKLNSNSPINLFSAEA